MSLTSFLFALSVLETSLEFTITISICPTCFCYTFAATVSFGAIKLCEQNVKRKCCSPSEALPFTTVPLTNELVASESSTRCAARRDGGEAVDAQAAEEVQNVGERLQPRQLLPADRRNR